MFVKCYFIHEVPWVQCIQSAMMASRKKECHDGKSKKKECHDGKCMAKKPNSEESKNSSDVGGLMCSGVFADVELRFGCVLLRFGEDVMVR